MAQPTFQSAKNFYFYFYIGDFSGYFEECDFSKKLQALKSTTASAGGGETYLPGLTDATLTLKANADQNASYLLTKLDAAMAEVAPVNWMFGPQDNTATHTKFSGTAVVTDYKVVSKVSDIVRVDVTLQQSGAVTLGTF